KEAYIQLVRGVQEWQDGCVYQGDFGLDMKLGYGEFSWPTGEVGGFRGCPRQGLATYPDGRQDVGLWVREGFAGMPAVLVRLAFSLQVHCHTDIVNLLLDSGADVNRYTDEGLTPLSMCFLLYYPSTSFKPNIAERMAPKSQEAPNMPVNPNLTFSFPEMTNFESDLLERSAQAHSMLKAPSFSATGFDKGTMRKMALAVVERRTRWLTIELLLHRGADPNLCRVPMQALFFAVKAGDVAGVRLLLEHGARTNIQLPAELGALTPLHIAAALPGEEGVRITELLLHTVTDVDARVADEDDVYKPSKLDLLPSSLKLNNEAGPAGIYHSRPTCVPDEGGRTALHVACEREDSYKCARDIVRLLLSHRANPNVLWSGHSPLSLSIASGNDLIVKELLSHGADPNLLLTRGLGNALCVACDLTYEHQRSMDSKLALIDRLIDYGADILNPVTLTQGDKVAVGTAVDYGYFRFYQVRLYTPVGDRGRGPGAVDGSRASIPRKDRVTYPRWWPSYPCHRGAGVVTRQEQHRSLLWLQLGRRCSPPDGSCCWPYAALATRPLCPSTACPLCPRKACPLCPSTA
uniref:Ankyrin repeat and MYND domain containing 1 n=1 Tax=Panthera tigris altaica TaxID=74533 RepID=A0A8C9M3Q1_PANTA